MLESFIKIICDNTEMLYTIKTCLPYSRMPEQTTNTLICIQIINSNDSVPVGGPELQPKQFPFSFRGLHSGKAKPFTVSQKRITG